jgi:2-polyprenyl-6-methoxyphenol hydroxylase-like FAD-dependent oxidoreductase/DNA-binding CsgD family transcriptional regulator
VLAYWLHRFGFRPTVIERIAELRVGGGGHAVDLFGPVVELMDWTGVLPEVERARTQTEVIALVRDRGRPVEVSAEMLSEGVSERHIEIMRGNLAKIVYEAARGQVEYVFDDSIATVHDDGSRVEVTFERGRRRTFDLIVGADGLHSITRRLVFGPEESFLRFLGGYLAVFTVPNYLQPQPGLALLRLGQGKKPAAAASVRRALSEADDWTRRASLLPAQVEIEVAVGGRERARAAASELDDIARDHPSEVLFAMAAKAAGVVAAAEGDAQRALLALRRALHLWQELEAPYEAAQTRVLLSEACRALGDGETADLELAAAREAFTWLRAGPDIARVETLAGRTHGDAHGLTAREMEVLRVLAAGKSNREIAGALIISERTVARHLQNIFAKLGVSSRTAASVFAVEQKLL